MTSLIVTCALLTAATLFYIFRPLLTGGNPLFADLEGSPNSLKRLLRKKETVYENIKDLDFEYKMGKLADEDYQRLRSEYEQEVYAVMREIEQIKPETLQKAGTPQVVAVLKSGKKPRK
ncbi:MAG: hypothetical protein L0387_17725 [Acidobacteria bacterium]|nr:hypothetical protein [Acidobacteriota bacterium]MCI0623471.1 hypothetical protein [Acidobacteriota bacterium]MCI0723991.1 hypothetical protein [Acidobacteriota bacterium]